MDYNKLILSSSDNENNLLAPLFISKHICEDVQVLKSDKEKVFKPSKSIVIFSGNFDNLDLGINEDNLTKLPGKLNCDNTKLKNIKYLYKKDGDVKDNEKKGKTVISNFEIKDSDSESQVIIHITEQTTDTTKQITEQTIFDELIKKLDINEDGTITKTEIIESGIPQEFIDLIDVNKDENITKEELIQFGNEIKNKTEEFLNDKYPNWNNKDSWEIDGTNKEIKNLRHLALACFIHKGTRTKNMDINYVIYILWLKAPDFQNLNKNEVEALNGVNKTSELDLQERIQEELEKSNSDGLYMTESCNNYNNLEKENDIILNENDNIIIYGRAATNFSYGLNLKTGFFGYFPFTYTKIYKKECEEEEKKPAQDKVFKIYLKLNETEDDECKEIPVGDPLRTKINEKIKSNDYGAVQDSDDKYYNTNKTVLKSELQIYESNINSLILNKIGEDLFPSGGDTITSNYYFEFEKIEENNLKVRVCKNNDLNLEGVKITEDPSLGGGNTRKLKLKKKTRQRKKSRNTKRKNKNKKRRKTHTKLSFKNKKTRKLNR